MSGEPISHKAKLLLQLSLLSMMLLVLWVGLAVGFDHFASKKERKELIARQEVTSGHSKNLEIIGLVIVSILMCMSSFSYRETHMI